MKKRFVPFPKANQFAVRLNVAEVRREGVDRGGGIEFPRDQQEEDLAADLVAERRVQGVKRENTLKRDV